MKIKLLTQVLVMTLALSSGLSSAALAGSGPGGPAPIVAPAGFATDYAVQARLVESTCWLTQPQAYDAVQRIFTIRKTNLDQRLAKAGKPASPTYSDFANQASSNCPKG